MAPSSAGFTARSVLTATGDHEDSTGVGPVKTGNICVRIRMVKCGRMRIVKRGGAAVAAVVAVRWSGGGEVEWWR